MFHLLRCLSLVFHKHFTQGIDIGLFHGTKATVTRSAETGTQCLAPGLGDRAQAGQALGNDDAGGSTSFTFDAEAMLADVGLAANQ